ncbi:MAG: ABC transporter ATP-binding protein [Oscillospiraceae bacterium]|nr:ABC transporter ATP-binding protein [Oscillospiraceae bacterium]
MSILELKNISYTYDKKKYVIKNINYSFEKGKIYAIAGKSGAGKTTLLSVLSSLAAPTEGQILLNGNDISKIDKYRFRSTEVGVIFQNFNLLSHLTARENVVLSMDISSKKISNKNNLAAELLKKVEIDDDDIDRRVLQLSGGQQQRVAIARALSYNPDIILADEPTGNLDTETQNEIMKIFRNLADEGKCIIIVTHSPDVVQKADTVYELIKG